jgi:hypothetical protein
LRNDRGKWHRPAKWRFAAFRRAFSVRSNLLTGRFGGHSRLSRGALNDVLMVFQLAPLRGKARAPYEFGCKVSIVIPVTAPQGGQFRADARALHGNPYEMVTRAIASTTIPTGSGSGSAARSAASPKPFAVRCGVAPPSSP